MIFYGSYNKFTVRHPCCYWRKTKWAIKIDFYCHRFLSLPPATVDVYLLYKRPIHFFIFQSFEILNCNQGEGGGGIPILNSRGFEDESSILGCSNSSRSSEGGEERAEFCSNGLGSPLVVSNSSPFHSKIMTPSGNRSMVPSLRSCSSPVTRQSSSCCYEPDDISA